MDIAFVRNFFEVATLLKAGDRGMTLEELSYAWINEYPSYDEVPISWKIFNRDR